MPEQHTSAIRRTILFSGQVQGVGFRYTTRAVASRFTVTGHVRNLRDGRVELVAEGEPAELERFQGAVEDAMSGYIDEAAATEAPATGEFNDFTIAF
jgi:acylphosphatase